MNKTAYYIGYMNKLSKDIYLPGIGERYEEAWKNHPEDSTKREEYAGVSDLELVKRALKKLRNSGYKDKVTIFDSQGEKHDFDKEAAALNRAFISKAVNPVSSYLASKGPISNLVVGAQLLYDPISRNLRKGTAAGLNKLRKTAPVKKGLGATYHQSQNAIKEWKHVHPIAQKYALMASIPAAAPPGSLPILAPAAGAALLGHRAVRIGLKRSPGWIKFLKYVRNQPQRKAIAQFLGTNPTAQQLNQFALTHFN